MQGTDQARAEAEAGQEEALSLPLLEARAVHKSYGATRALAGVDLRVGPGELVGLLGPNGAGKSTLVQIACGLARADAGVTLIEGEPSSSPSARRRLGYLAELFRFPEWLTVDEVLATHQRLAGARGGGRERERLLESVGLGEVAMRRVGALSKGQQQRLGLAQALVGEPRLLILDEPTSALDPVGRALVRALLEDLRDRGCGVLLNSHLLTEVELTCDRVVLLRDGRIIQEGATADLLRPTGVTITTAAGPQRFPGAESDDVARLVRELVAAGQDVLNIDVQAPTLQELYLAAMSPRDEP